MNRIGEQRASATVPVALPGRRYDVLIEAGALDRLGEVARSLAPHQRCALLADASVYDFHGRRATDALEAAGYEVAVSTMPPGERRKTLETVRGMYDVLLERRLERKSPVIALGGGVCGDTAGFVAATYLRGVPLIQCPTTLLAMVDASVGGKTGVNVPQGKNLIGAFYQPAGVVIDPFVLQTLPPRELRCGLAECIKHGVIRDAELFAFIRDELARIQAMDPATLVELLRRNVEIKASVVVEDERESGVRAHLNFGHTFAHAIESTTGYERFLHGEAVAIGMVAAANLAAETGMCDADVAEQVRGLLEAAGLPTSAELPETEALMEAMKLDKKVQDDRIRLVLPTRIGHVEVREDVPAERIAAAWETVRA